ncbi:MAG: thiamine diphosphokinase [Pseudomonadota bacterium]
MAVKTLDFADGLTLVGAGALESGAISRARTHAPGLVAADGAADALWAFGHQPDAIFGDMDSLSDVDLWRSRGVHIEAISEQETTDFEKCLYRTSAPFYVGVGFTGKRLDHTLAVLHAMLARPKKRVVLLGEAEVMAFAPAGQLFELDLAAGAIVSFFPLLPATGISSKGLKWSIDGLSMNPGQQIGTSNIATNARVRAGFDGPGVLVMVGHDHLETLLAMVRAA